MLDKKQFQDSATLAADTYEYGVAIFTTDLEKYDFCLQKGMSLPIKEGDRFAPGSTVVKCLEQKIPMKVNVPYEVYKTRITTFVNPLIDEAGVIHGVIGISIPRMHGVAREFENISNIMLESLSEDGCVIITTLAGVVFSKIKGDFDVPQLRVGTPVSELKIAQKVIETKKSVDVQVDNYQDKWGPIRALAIPLFEEGEIIGVFGTVSKRSIPYQMVKMAGDTSTTTTEIASVIEQIAASASDVSANENKLVDLMIRINGQSKKISEISEFVKEVASETKLLGLNAAIEAARVGDAGRGFSVVADEIRKLSDQSRNTAKDISTYTVDIQNMINEATQVSESNSRTTQEVAAATQEVTASISELSHMADKLNNVAKQL